MYYTIYKITNKKNGKFYYGKHQTKNLNDKYLGSGKLIKEAIRKYGRDNFQKEVLFVFATASEMDEKERELVDQGAVNDPLCYNLSMGGFGGNLISIKGTTYDQFYGPERAADIRQRISESHRGERNPMYGKTHTQETRQQMRVKTSLRHVTQDMRRKAIETRRRRIVAGEIIPSMLGKKHREDSRRKTSESLKGKRWWHNGTERVRSYECPGDGWVLGRGRISEKNR